MRIMEFLIREATRMAKGKRNVTLQDMRNFMSDFYGDGYCDCEGTASVEEIDEAIADCEMMLQESIDRADKEEISFWRKMLQENKVSRRELLTA